MDFLHLNEYPKTIICYLARLFAVDSSKIRCNFTEYTAVTRNVHTPSREERRFVYFSHLSKEFLEQMIPHLKALI